MAGCLLRVVLHEVIPLLRSYQLGKSIGTTNIHTPVMLVKTDGFIQTTYFCKYPFFHSKKSESFPIPENFSPKYQKFSELRKVLLLFQKFLVSENHATIIGGSLSALQFLPAGQWNKWRQCIPYCSLCLFSQKLALQFL